MSFGKKLFKGLKGGAKAALSGGLSLVTKKGRKEFRRDFRSLRKNLGVTSKNKLVRSLRRNLLGKNVLASSQPVSASTYQYQPRSIASLMGGR